MYLTDARTRPRSRARGDVPRRGIVYGITAWHPITGLPFLAYVGQTRQTLRAREEQHREDQPWGDTIVASFVITKGRWTNAQLDAREDVCIAELRPAYNIVGNRGNRRRIPPWDALAQRHARDDAAGVPRPRFVPPADRRPPAWPPTRPAARRHSRRSSPATLVGRAARGLAARCAVAATWVVAWAVAWAVLALTVGLALVAWQDVPPEDGAWVGAGAAALALGGFKARRRPRRRGRGR